MRPLTGREGGGSRAHAPRLGTYRTQEISRSAGEVRAIIAVVLLNSNFLAIGAESNMMRSQWPRSRATARQFIVRRGVHSYPLCS